MHVNEEDTEGRTALFDATSNSKATVVYALLEHDSSLNIENMSEYTPLQQAVALVEMSI